MLSGPVAESESASRVDRIASNFSGEKESRGCWIRRGMMGTKNEGLGTQHLKVNTELRHLAFSYVESVVPFEERE